MSQKRLFRQNHPILAGFLLLAGIVFIFFGGITFFVIKLTHRTSTDIFISRPGIGIIELKGVITRSEQTISDLIKFKNNNDIKAIVVRIDSPGGAVGASQEIFRELRRVDKVKPVVASMGSVAASGGYYSAIGAEKIVASPGTLTGSMGVILKFANLEEIFNKIGYKSETIKSGKYKDMGSPGRSLTPEERVMLQALLDNVHSQFIRDIAESRNISEEEVRKIADGRIFSGEQAHDLGLVDQLGNFTDAVLLAADLGGLHERDPYLIYPERNEFNVLKFIGGKKGEALLNSLIKPEPVLAYQWPEK
jgi:protease-4